MGHVMAELETSLRYWLETWAASRDVSPGRKAADETRIHKYVLPYLGRRSVTRLTQEVVEDWIEDLEAEGVGKSTVHASLMCLRQSIDLAIERMQLRMDNPARGVVVPDLNPIQQPTPEDIPSEEDLQAILSCIDEYYAAMVLLAARTGAKWEECVGLTVEDIDFDHGFVTLGRVKATERGGEVEYTPGTGTEVRNIEMTMDLVDALRKHLELTESFRDKKRRWVFLGKRDHKHPLRPNFNNWVWRPALEKAGINPRKYTFHDLRHTAAVRMIMEEDWPVERVSKALGHKNPTTTKRLYLRYFREREERRSSGKKTSIQGYKGSGKSYIAAIAWGADGKSDVKVFPLADVEESILQ